MSFSNRRALGIATALTLVVFTAHAEIRLPGTQPEDGVEFGKVDQCYRCHGNTKNGPADPFISWQGSMMAQAARDPVFRAALAIANQDIADVGEYCLRCHAPRGWIEDRSKPGDGSALSSEDMHGVSCDLCHHLVDPLSPEAKKLVKDVPPDYGNAMMVVEPENKVRGPYGDGTGAMPHGVMKSPFHASSELCALCHNVSNPLFAKDVYKQSPHEYGHIERTYSEWALSAFPARKEKGTCQSCHYEPVEGGGQASRYGDLHRDHFVIHGPVGGSIWVRDAIAATWPAKNIIPAALNAASERTRKLLRTAATLDLSFPEAGKARLRITNKTGHKLPTGYPEGRRMWVNARFLDGSGKVLKEIGRYAEKEDTVSGNKVSAPTLLDPEATRVYECLPGISESMAKKHNKKPGASFHFVLNDVTVKDNRIPPEGFKNEAFAEHHCQPVGAEYADGQYWDDVDFALPQGTVSVSVRLMYQSVSWEYMKFLAEEDTTDDWGTRLYEAYEKTGKCPPEVIAEIAAPVSR